MLEREWLIGEKSGKKWNGLSYLHPWKTVDKGDLDAFSVSFLFFVAKLDKSNEILGCVAGTILRFFHVSEKKHDKTQKFLTDRISTITHKIFETNCSFDVK